MNTGPPYAPRWARLTRKHLAPLDQLPDEPTRGLSKSLTRLDLLVIGVAQIIGAGIFIISGVGIKIAGPGIILSFLVGGLACTLAVCLGVLVLRFTAPALPRPFRCPGGKAVALALVCLGLMLSLPAASWWRLGLWLLAGLPFMSFRRSIPLVLKIAA